MRPDADNTRNRQSQRMERGKDCPREAKSEEKQERKRHAWRWREEKRGASEGVVVRDQEMSSDFDRGSQGKRERQGD